MGPKGLTPAGELGGDDRFTAAQRLQLQPGMGAGTVMGVTCPLQGQALEIGHMDRGHGGKLLAQLAADEGQPPRGQVMTGDQAPKLAADQD